MGKIKWRGALRALPIAAVAITGLSLAACAAGDKKGSTMDSSNMEMPAGAAASKPMGVADADMQAVLDQLGAMHGKPVESLSAAEARKQPTPTDAVKALLAKQGKPAAPPPGATLTNRMVAGAASELPANIYTPDGPGPFPVIVYYHGGGWVIASKDVYDGGARALAIDTKSVVISADYRLAPEHKFPAAHDDALAVYKWALANAASLKGDPARVALAGESAGGNLAVATAIAARDATLQAPLAVISVYPIAVGNTNTPAYAENANAKPLNRAMMAWFFDKYARTDADLADPRINLVGADLRGLPPVAIINAQIDPLRGDGEMLAEKIRAAGGSVQQKTYDGVTHEFYGMGAVVAKAKDAEGYAAAALATAFHR